MVETYLDEQYYDYFVPENAMGGNKPIWVNEMGFATTRGKTEQEQANWFLRAACRFLANKHIQELGFYEIKDLKPDGSGNRNDPNYHLGLTYADRTKKLAFWTVQMISSLLNVGTLTTADREVTVKVTRGASGELYNHLFKRSDGAQVLFIYDKEASPTVSVAFATRGTRLIAINWTGVTRGIPTLMARLCGLSR